jgi:hypothetical protein
VSEQDKLIEYLSKEIGPNLFQSDRDLINSIETKMKAMPNQIELPVKHHFSYGTYARELFIPKGTILVGKIHKFPQLNILTAGDMSVFIDGAIERIQGPYIVNSPAGVKRIAYAWEDSIWITVHGTHEKDVDKIEHQFIAQSEDEYLSFVNDKLIEGRSDEIKQIS